MIQTEMPAEVQSPAQRAGILATLACAACQAYLFWAGPAAVAWLPVRGAGWLVYLVLPVAFTFAILNASCFHRELGRVTRAGLLFLISLLIFAGIRLATAALAFLALANLPLSRFHY